MTGYSNLSIQQNPHEILAEIKLVALDVTTLVVEGPSDCRFLQGLVDRRRVQVIPAHNKERALKVADGLHAARLARHALVLVDRDDDDRTGRNGCVIYTHARDLDTEVVCSRDVLARVAFHHVGCESNQDVAEFVRWVRDVGTYFRAVRQFTDPTLRLRWQSVRKFFDDGCPANTAELLKQLGVSGDVQQLATKVDSVVADKPALAECRGHDLHVIIAWRIQRQIGEQGVQNLLMSIIGLEDFLLTPTGRDIDDWARELSIRLWRGEVVAA